MTPVAEATSPTLVPDEEEEVTLDTTSEEEVYIPAEPTKDQLASAEAVLKELKKRVGEYSDESTIDAMLQLVDVHSAFSTPEEWPADTEQEYSTAQVIANIAKYLSAGCRKLDLDPKHTQFLFRNKDKWLEAGRPKRGATARVNTRMQFLLGGDRAVVEVNYHHWLTLNPLQKVQAVYRLLRERDGMGKKIDPDFVGYYDELELFGLRTFTEMLALGQALKTAALVEHPHQLTLFE